MNKRLIRNALIVCGGGGLIALLAMEVRTWVLESKLNRAFGDEELSRRMAEQHGNVSIQQPMIAPVDPKKSIRLAIGALGLGDQSKEGELSDLLLTKLGGVKGVEMVERPSLDAVLRELNLGTAGLVRAKDAMQVGKLVRADWFLLASSVLLKGTNNIIVRMVDARTGVLRDAEAFDCAHSTSQLAAELSGFVQRCRAEVGEAKAKVFLSVGTFGDVSLNSRRATLPGELRAYLTEAYRGSSLTLLEREFANALYREMQLDLMGLTDKSATNGAPMQSAYWMVDGWYQSYETSQFEVELSLNVWRLFGRSQRFTLREKPGEPLFKRVRETLDEAMARDRGTVFLTRMTEVRAQLFAGRDLLISVKAGMGANALGDWLDYTGRMSEGETLRHRRNAEEAVRAFETVLLLDPENREARAQMASCLRSPFLGKFDEARDLYRELIETETEDHWAAMARSELADSFYWAGPQAKRRWFESALQRSGHSSAKQYFESQLKGAREEEILAAVGSTEAQGVAEERLFRAMQAWDASTRQHAFIVDFDNTGLGKYVDAFGTNRLLAAQKLVALLPKLQGLATNLAPHIFAGVVTFQVETNAPIISEFERGLDGLLEQPPQTPELSYYVDLLGSPVYRWAERKGLYRIAAKAKEIKVQFSNRERGGWVSEDEHLELAYNYVRAEEWQRAMEIFQSLSNRPVQMGNSGIWGRAFTVSLPGKEAAACREKLGLPAVKNPREFELGKSWLCLHEPNNAYRGEAAVFETGSDGLWIAVGNHLMRVGFDSQTNLMLLLPNNAAPVTSMVVGEASIWIGTAGDGLIEVDKANSKYVQLRSADGLMMDEITALELAADTLWIGYGDGTRGGLGRLNLTTRSLTSFTPSMVKSASAPPPAKPVRGIHSATEGDVWFLSRGTLGRYHATAGTWEYFLRNATSLAVNGGQVIEGDSVPLTTVTLENRSGTDGQTNAIQRIKKTVTHEEFTILQRTLRTNRSGMRIVGTGGGSMERGGLVARSQSDGKVRSLTGTEELPHSPTAMCLRGRDLWVGGLGYIALVDVEQGEIKSIAYVDAREVDQIDVAGEYLWVKYGKHLFRKALKDLQ